MIRINRPLLPRPSLRFIPVWRRNLRVWRKLMMPSLLGNFGEPVLYLLAFGYGFGRLVGELDGMSYMVFIASGIICSSAMFTASFEGMYSAYTRMAEQNTWLAMLGTPLTLDDIVFAEAIWAATKGLISAGRSWSWPARWGWSRTRAPCWRFRWCSLRPSPSDRWRWS
jgi:lipooligosaccharide transport system permease protein